MGALVPADVVALLDAPAGAYVHVPFCARICPFCPYDKVVPGPGQPERYFAALRTEVRRSLDAGAGPFTSLYVGGGTPTLFPELLAGVVALIPVTGERAIEVLPTHATAARLDALAAMGFTAVSIGAQSFSDAALRHLSRPHDAAAARAAVAAAVGRFALVDVDLIVDVEFDDAHAGAFLRDLTTCLELGVDQVSTYPLMRFGYTPFGSARHDRRREHQVLAEATRIAAAHRYERRSVWTFNRRESASYTSITRRRYLGFGASAASFLGRDHLINHFGVETYIGAVEAGRVPVARHLRLGALGGAAYDAFWQAYAGRIRPAELASAYGRWAAAVRVLLPPLAVAGLVRRDDAAWALTPRGFAAYHDLERWVTYHLIEPLWAQMLTEHEREGCHAEWATPSRARRTHLWPLVERVLARESRG